LNTPSNNYNNDHDYHSSANSDEVRVTHLVLSLKVNFDEKALIGEAKLVFTRLTTEATSLVLDARDLIIAHITDEHKTALSYEVSNVNVTLGQKITVALSATATQVIIHYRTSPQSQGLQWLTPEQTLGKAKPYLFSQSQPINARSWIPLQDTPKARLTFEASIQVPPGQRAVMSAINSPELSADGVFHFAMDKSMPTHLLAIAVGDLAYGELSDRTGVYTEPGMLASALGEFNDVEQMMSETEAILGPYQWGRFDILVLPPSFPFGGMENPCLTFITPSLITGDKSLVSTLAHELAHSWTGNLVSNATWRDLWLNEGFTTYFTNRIVEAIYGHEQANLEWVIEYGRLKEEIQTLELDCQTLPANVQLQDPNLAFNRFTYDKASMFVHELEQRLGRAAFDRFLYQYVQDFAFKAITTETFIEYAKQTLLKEHRDKLTLIELNTWVYGEGLPDWFIPPSSNSFVKVDEALKQFSQGCSATELNVSDWRVQHWQYFLSHLLNGVTQAQLMDLDESFALSQSLNAEIACDWFRLAVRHYYDPVLPAVKTFLCHIGRAKFVRPLYAELQVAGYHKEVKAIYTKARGTYHPSLTVQLDISLANSLIE
jgi:leukotriene-A4 hydrolase